MVESLENFSIIQHIRRDGNCEIYAAIEGLLNCLISLTTNETLFRKEVYDFIDHHINSVLTNFQFKQKILDPGQRRERLCEKSVREDVMKRVW